MDVIGKPVKTVTGLADDYGRTWRQRTVITALFDKMKSQPLSKWMEVADKVLENVRTDLDNDTILKYMKDAVMMGTTQIHQMQIPDNGYYRNDKIMNFRMHRDGVWFRLMVLQRIMTGQPIRKHYVSLSLNMMVKMNLNINQKIQAR